MSDLCCVLPDAADTERGIDICPNCGRRGKPVGSETIHALVRPGREPSGGFPDGFTCLNPRDATLYFFAGEPEPITKEDVGVRVGFKEEESPHLVCYCFEHTQEAIQEEYQRLGESLIEADIREKVVGGLCSCEVKNPTGRCCLGEVRAAYKELEVPEEVEP